MNSVADFPCAYAWSSIRPGHRLWRGYLYLAVDHTIVSRVREKRSRCNVFQLDTVTGRFSSSKNHNWSCSCREPGQITSIFWPGDERFWISAFTSRILTEYFRTVVVAKHKIRDDDGAEGVRFYDNYDASFIVPPLYYRCTAHVRRVFLGQSTKHVPFISSSSYTTALTAVLTILRTRRLSKRPIRVCKPRGYRRRARSDICLTSPSSSSSYACTGVVKYVRYTRYVKFVKKKRIGSFQFRTATLGHDTTTFRPICFVFIVVYVFTRNRRIPASVPSPFRLAYSCTFRNCHFRTPIRYIEFIT